MSDIKIKNLFVSFNTNDEIVNIIKDLNMTFKKGLTTVIIGESGAGKSVIAQAILRLLDEAIIRGEIYYNKKDIFKMSKKEIRELRKNEISYVPQGLENALNPTMKIYKQLQERKILDINYIYSVLKRLLFKKPKEIVDSYSFELSGGMRQRVLTTMGILNTPKWVILDEPTKGLDPLALDKIIKIIKELKKKTSIILITHDLHLANNVGDKFIILNKGKIIEKMKKEDFLINPKHEYTKELFDALYLKRDKDDY